MSKTYRIGELSGVTGLTPDALRYYERRGLLERPARTSGGFRVYGPSAVERVRFIKRAQSLGFSLDDVRELVRFNGKGGLRRCARVRDLLQGRLGQLETMLADLSVLQGALRTALDHCEQALETKDAAACPVIEFNASTRETDEG